MKKIKIKCKLDYSKIPNPMHLDACIRFPKIVFDDKRKFKRSRVKNDVRKLLKDY